MNPPTTAWQNVQPPENLGRPPPVRMLLGPKQLLKAGPRIGKLKIQAVEGRTGNLAVTARVLPMRIAIVIVVKKRLRKVARPKTADR